MMFLALLGPLVWACHAAWGLPDGILYQFTHPWEGFTVWDSIMPCFLFMCGAAIPFSLERRLAKKGGCPDAAYWKHVFGRVALLWVLGLIVQGQFLSLDPLNVRPYNNTLQTIAVGYLAMAALVCVRSWKVRIAVPAGCFVLYGILVHFGGDYSMAGNFAEFCEQKVLAALLPAASKALHETGELGYLGRLREIGEIHYTWWLTSLMFVFMTACGYFSTRILTATDDRKRNVIRLALFGVALLALGWALALGGIRMVKHIFSVSFTAQAMGWSMLALSATYFFADILGFRRGTSLVILFGRTSLLAYMIGEFFWPCFMFTGNYVTGGLDRWIGAPVRGVIACLVAEALLVGCLAVRSTLRLK